MSSCSSNLGFYKNCDLWEQLHIYTNLNKSISTVLGIVKPSSRKSTYSEYSLLVNQKMNIQKIPFNTLGKDVKQTANLLDIIMQIWVFSS